MKNKNKKFIQLIERIVEKKLNEMDLPKTPEYEKKKIKDALERIHYMRSRLNATEDMYLNVAVPAMQEIEKKYGEEKIGTFLDDLISYNFKIDEKYNEIKDMETRHQIDSDTVLNALEDFIKEISRRS